MIYYCDNWYLDVWDYGCEGLCSFVVDCIYKVWVVDIVVCDVDDSELDEQFGVSYGIFFGVFKGWVIIVFSVKVVCWVVDEYWYFRQQGWFLLDGCYELKVLYSVFCELLMDVFYYGLDVEIIELIVLCEQVKVLLVLVLSNYEQ